MVRDIPNKKYLKNIIRKGSDFMISKTHFYILAAVILFVIFLALFIVMNLVFTLLAFIFDYGINVHTLHKENMPLKKALLLNQSCWASIRKETFNLAKDLAKFEIVFLIILYIITMIIMFHMELYHLAFS